MSVGQLVAAVTGGASVLVTGSSGAALLPAALAQLLARTGSRIRVLHVRPPLDLQEFLKQVAQVGGALDGSRLEQGFEALTVLGADCDRIAVLVEDADKMPLETLDCVELALGMEPCLQVILVGQSGISDMLALDGFAGLRRRIALHVALPDAEPSPAVQPSRPQPTGKALPAPSVPAEALPRPYRTRPPQFLAGAALVAGLVLVTGSSLRRPVPSGGATQAMLVAPPSLDSPGLPGVQKEAGTAVPAPLHRPEAAADGPSDSNDHPFNLLPSVQPAPAARPGLTPAPAAPTPSAPAATADAALAVPDPMPLAQPVFPEQPAAAPGPTAFSAPSPVPHRAQSRPAFVRSERVADWLPAPAHDTQRCRSIILRLQLGETPNDGERTYLRNGCR